MNAKRAQFIPLLTAVLLLVASALACGRQQGQGDPTTVIIVATATATPAGAGEAPTEQPADPTSTSVPGRCTDGMTFRADVTVPDGTTFAPGETFVKTWRVQNTGTCDWTGYRITFDHGEPMGTADQPLPDTLAGQETEISIEMTAPGGTGNYRGYWRIESADGANLGTLFCDILVEGEGDGEDSPEDPSAEPSGYPDLTIETASVFANIPTTPEAVMVAITVRNAGDGDAAAFSVTWLPHEGWTGDGWNQIACSHDVDGLPAGASVALDCTYTYPAYGEMHWLAVADSEDEIYEEYEDNNEFRGRVPIFADAPEAETVTLQSLPAEDGFARGVNGGESVSLDGNIRVGDGAQNQRNEGFLSFDLSGIPQGATIQEAMLDLSDHTLRGEPFERLGLLRIYFVQYGDLGVEDYVAGNPGGSITQSGPPSQLLPTHQVQQLVGEGAVRFQVRMQFEAISDNDDAVDGLIFSEGSPSLTVTYIP